MIGFSNQNRSVLIIGVVEWVESGQLETILESIEKVVFFCYEKPIIEKLKAKKKEPVFARAEQALELQ